MSEDELKARIRELEEELSKKKEINVYRDGT